MLPTSGHRGGGAAFERDRHLDVKSSRARGVAPLPGRRVLCQQSRPASRVELRRRLQLPSNFPFVSMAATARSALVLLPLLLVLLPVWRTLAVSGAPPPQAHEASGPAEGSSNSNSSVTTAAAAGKEGRTLSGFNADSSMVQRALYVLVAITAFGLLYFLIRAVR